MRRRLMMVVAIGALLGLLITLRDEDQTPITNGTVSLATPRNGLHVLTGPVWGCAEVAAPGFLVTELCVDRPNWGPGEATVVLERAEEVRVLCDLGDGAAKCSGRLLFRCLSTVTPDFGRCEDDVCDCPAGPGSVVTSLRNPFKGEAAEVLDGKAVFRITEPGTLVLTGEWARDVAIVLRQVGDRTFPAKLFRDDDATRPVLLPAGTFTVRTMRTEEQNLELRNIVIHAGETTTAALAPPDGPTVRVLGSPMSVVLRAGNGEWTYAPMGDPLDLPVPAGAELTVGTESGCCSWTNPPSPVECTAERAETCGGLFDSTMVF